MTPRRPYDQAAASRQLLSESQQVEFPRVVHVSGQAFVLLKNVFSPEVFWSTRLFSAMLPVQPGDAVLEIGCGAGVTATVAALQGAARVLAVDINPQAVRNATLNAELHGVTGRFEARVSDVFSEVKPRERFDIIYWNLPFILRPRGYRYRNVLERALFDPDYTYADRYLTGLRHHLTPKGRAFVGFADFGDRVRLERLAVAHRFSLALIGTGHGIEGKSVEFQMFELRAC